MGVRGKGTDPNAGLQAQLRGLRDQRRKLTADTQSPDAREALVEANAKRQLLDELKDAGALSGAADAALPQLQQDRLALEDPTLLKYARTLGLFEGGAEKKISSEQTAALLALMGDRWSAVERWLVDVSLPKIPEEMRAGVTQKLEGERAADKARGVSGSKERLTANSLAFLTSAGPGIASSALYLLGLIGGPLGLGVSLTMSALGGQLGQVLQKKMALKAVEFGANRFDGQSVGGPLERIAGRAQGADKLTAANVGDWLKKEVTVASELLKIAEGTGPDAAAVKAYVGELGKLAKSGAKGDALLQGVNKARESMLKGLSGNFKFEQASLPNVSNDYMLSLVEAHDRFTLAIENPVASSLLETLLQRHGVDTPQQKEGAKLTGPELSALKKAVGPEASIAEYGALRILERNGLINLEEVWGKDFRNKLPKGIVDETDLKSTSDAGAGQRALASRLNMGAKIGFVAVPLLLALTGVGIPIALAAGIGGSIAGAAIGNQVQKRGEVAQVMAGVDAQHAKTEYGFALDLARSDLPKNDRDVAGAIAAQAGEIKLLTDSALVQSVMPKKGQAAPGSMFAQIEEFAELRGHIYQQLADYAGELEKLAKSSLPPAKMREQVAELQKTLMDDGFMQNVLLDGLRSSAVPDMPPKLGAVVTSFLQFQREMETDPKDASAEARALLAAVKDLPKGQRIDFAKLPMVLVARTIVDGPKADGALKPDVMEKVVAGRKESLETLQQLWNKHAPIPEKRAIEVAEEALAHLWTQYLPDVGVHVEGGPPELVDAKVTKKTDPNGLPLFEVTAKLDDGGTVKMPVTAFGIPALDVAEFRLSNGRLAEIAGAAVRRQLFLANPAGGTIQSTTKIAQADASRESFEVATSAGKFRIDVMQEGIPLISTFAKA